MGRDDERLAAQADERQLPATTRSTPNDGDGRVNAASERARWGVSGYSLKLPEAIHLSGILLRR